MENTRVETPQAEYTKTAGQLYREARKSRELIKKRVTNSDLLKRNIDTRNAVMSHFSSISPDFYVDEQWEEVRTTPSEQRIQAAGRHLQYLMDDEDLGRVKIYCSKTCKTAGHYVLGVFPEPGLEKEKELDGLYDILFPKKL